MKDQPNRLSSDARHFAGVAIDRRRPVKFKINGQVISGFEGDTVLSAVLAAGFDAIGLHDGWPMALTARHAPPIVAMAHKRDPGKALPMQRTPVTQGADYTTLGTGGVSKFAFAIGRLRGSRSLGLDLDAPIAMQRPWLADEAELAPGTDMVVIGGGVAGMTAAIAAAKAGLRVSLVEASWQLGGHAQLFGSQEGEEPPEQSVARLVAAVDSDDAISVMLGTQAVAARPGVVRVHSVAIVHGVPVPRTLDLPAPHIVIATGVIERLPIFAGNRLPGVSMTLEAYNLAHQFGIWPGKTALLATVSNVAYRLSTLASDAGITVARIIDGRSDPQSRFIEFSKAYGITMVAGTIAGEARLIAKSRQISLTPQSALHHPSPAEPPLLADRLVVCGGWQPDLTLWHMAGGESRWNPQSARLDPILQGPSGMALAGSAAGYLSGHACLRSGKAAVAQVLGRRRIAVEERLIDPIYETPDDPASIAKPDADAAPPSFLDGGQSYIERPEEKRSRCPGWMPFLRRPPAWSLADMPQPLAIADIAAGTQLGAIPAQSAGIVAQERVALIPINIAHPEPARTQSAEPSSNIPPFLAGRFGSNGLAWSISPLEKRRLEVGALIYPNADETDPFKAVGVVLSADNNGAVALLAASSALPNSSGFVREDNRAFPVQFLGPASLGLSPALGSGPGAP